MTRAIVVDVRLTLSVDDELSIGLEMFVNHIDDEPIVERSVEFCPSWI